MTRSPDAMLLLISGFDVRNNPAFLPGILGVPVNGQGRADCVFNGQPLQLMHYTRCNSYAQALSVALGCPLPAFMTANQLRAWLESPAGAASKWEPCDVVTALARTNAGVPVVVAAVDEPHGHIAFGAPTPQDPSRLYCTAAGAVNTPRMLVSEQFGHLAASVVYFSHP